MTIDGRSVPVGSMDAVAAVVAASYGPDASRQSLATALGSPSPDGAPVVGALSDALLMRYGVDDMAAGQIAYFQELCPQYPGWPEIGGEDGEVARFFARVHGPCQQFADTAAPAVVGDLPSRPAAACIASTLDDGVTGRASADEWAAALGSTALRIETTQGQHGALDLVAKCASVIKVGGA